jgi:hypothetical protein
MVDGQDYGGGYAARYGGYKSVMRHAVQAVRSCAAPWRLSFFHAAMGGTCGEAASGRRDGGAARRRCQIGSIYCRWRPRRGAALVATWLSLFILHGEGGHKPRRPSLRRHSGAMAPGPNN